MILQVVKKELVELVKTSIMEEIVSKLMTRFDEEILPFEDAEDPVRPSVFREEFKNYLRQSIVDSIEVSGNSIKYGIGDAEKLGFGEELDPETTDGLKIIGTILCGIVGEYVLVTVDMAKEMFPNDIDYDLGRTGLAYLMPSDTYDYGVENNGWLPKPVWSFSNFHGIPDFFEVDIDLGKYINKTLKNLGERA